MLYKKSLLAYDFVSIGKQVAEVYEWLHASVLRIYLVQKLASYPRGTDSSSIPLSEPQISQN